MLYSEISSACLKLDDYNNRSIKTKRKGLPPAIYRQQALQLA